MPTALQVNRFSLLLFEGIEAGASNPSQQSSSFDRQNAVVACPASLRFRERSRPEATVIPACRTRHGHHRPLYTSADSQLAIGKQRSNLIIIIIIIEFI